MDIPFNFTSEQVKLIKRLNSEFPNVKFDKEKAQQLRQKWGETRRCAARAKKLKLQQRMDTCIWWIKRAVSPDRVAKPSFVHPMSDHAFVRYYERELGINVDRIKNALLDDAETKGKLSNFVKIDGQYVTYINS